MNRRQKRQRIVACVIAGLLVLSMVLGVLAYIG